MAEGLFIGFYDYVILDGSYITFLRLDVYDDEGICNNVFSLNVRM